MKNIHFLVSNTLNQQIEEVLLRLGINSKSEFFRMLALEYIKTNKIVSVSRSAESQPKLTIKEKMMLSTLETKAKSIDDLVIETGLPVSEITALLVQLLLKNRVTQTGVYWNLQENFRT